MINHLSVTEYGKIHNLDRATICRLISAGRLPAEKIGNQWVIRADTPRPEDRRVKSGQYRNWRKGKTDNREVQESKSETL